MAESQTLFKKRTLSEAEFAADSEMIAGLCEAVGLALKSNPEVLREALHSATSQVERENEIRRKELQLKSNTLGVVILSSIAIFSIAISVLLGILGSNTDAVLFLWPAVGAIACLAVLLYVRTRLLLTEETVQ